MPKIQISILAFPLHPIKVIDLRTKDLLMLWRKRPFLETLKRLLHTDGPCFAN